MFFSPYFSDLIKFDLELNGISIDDKVGKDVTINWKFDDFEDGETFWTDSNGLEMQKRFKNSRYSFKLDVNGTQNVSWNYYPVNSAIAMRNTEKNGSKSFREVQVTVMNERSQAGAATLTEGAIELIHNRRLLHDDDRGVGEALNETDSRGYGMKVNARYWLNIFDLQNGQSSQRELQNSIDKPLTFFFARVPEGLAKDNKEVFAPKSSRKQEPQLRDTFTNADDADRFGRMVFFPLWRNKILVRVENSADKFDFYSPTLQVDMQRFADAYWSSANPLSEVKVAAQIYEVDLTANMLEKEAVERKKRTQWRGTDDEAIKERMKVDEEFRAVHQPRDHVNEPLSSITLIPQEMRSFVIHYDVKPPADWPVTALEHKQPSEVDPETLI